MACKKESTTRICLSFINPIPPLQLIRSCLTCKGGRRKQLGSVLVPWRGWERTFSCPRVQGTQHSHIPWTLTEPTSAQLLCTPLLGRRKRENRSPSPRSCLCVGLQVGCCPASEEKVKDRKTVRLDWQNCTG